MLWEKELWGCRGTVGLYEEYKQIERFIAPPLTLLETGGETPTFPPFQRGGIRDPNIQEKVSTGEEQSSIKGRRVPSNAR